MIFDLALDRFVPAFLGTRDLRRSPSGLRPISDCLIVDRALYICTVHGHLWRYPVLKHSGRIWTNEKHLFHLANSIAHSPHRQSLFSGRERTTETGKSMAMVMAMVNRWQTGKSTCQGSGSACIIRALGRPHYAYHQCLGRA